MAIRQLICTQFGPSPSQLDWVQTRFSTKIGSITNKCVKALNLLHVLAHTSWGADQETLLLFYALIRYKLDYGCVVYRSARPSYLRMLDLIQNYAVQLCFGAFRTSPCSSLSVEANEPPLKLRTTEAESAICLKIKIQLPEPCIQRRL